MIQATPDAERNDFLPGTYKIWPLTHSLHLLLGEIFPVLHGHIRLLEARIFPVGDGNSFKEGLPQKLHLFFIF